ncbi:MAG: peptidoglycan DD-metalloendopeptidase family protein [Paludibacteraceae bacterium]|nr:peptidoglycan DD-metalloendopeptidase family protein [Paludibacteraceae bacterium]
MKIKTIAILLMITLATVGSYGQTRSQLEKKKKKLNSEMQTTQKMIKQTEKSRKGAENKLLLTKQSIKQGQEYINLLNSEITVLDKDIDSIKTAKDDYTDRLEQLRREYAANIKMLYRQSKRNSMTEIMFIISADNLNQGIRRFRYLQQLSTKRKAKAIEIGVITDSLASKETQLTENKMMKEQAMSEREALQKKLETQQKSQNKQLNSLKKKENELKKKQKEQQAQINKLNKKIQEAIEAEIAAQKKKQEEAAKKAGSSKTTTPSSNNTYALSKEEKLIAGNFEANRGKLPRPVERGNITGHFGVHPHPYLDQVSVNNKGIYIQSPAETEARAVFEGVVTSIFMLQGANQSVIIRHGNYSTVYNNLSSVYVKKGDKVTARQKIGKIFTDAENGNKTELYFLIYKDRQCLNPEAWLAK